MSRNNFAMPLISGILVPPEIDLDTGDFKLAYDGDLIRAYVYVFLQCQKWERLGLPEYGLKDYLFDTQPAVGLVCKEIEEDLIRYIPQAEFSCNGYQTDANELVVQVFWAYNQIEQPFVSVTFGDYDNG